MHQPVAGEVRRYSHCSRSQVFKCCTHLHNPIDVRRFRAMGVTGARATGAPGLRVGCMAARWCGASGRPAWCAAGADRLRPLRHLCAAHGDRPWWLHRPRQADARLLQRIPSRVGVSTRYPQAASHIAAPTCMPSPGRATGPSPRPLQYVWGFLRDVLGFEGGQSPGGLPLEGAASGREGLPRPAALRRRDVWPRHDRGLSVAGGAA